MPECASVVNKLKMNGQKLLVSLHSDTVCSFTEALHEIILYASLWVTIPPTSVQAFSEFLLYLVCNSAWDKSLHRIIIVKQHTENAFGGVWSVDIDRSTKSQCEMKCQKKKRESTPHETCLVWTQLLPHCSFLIRKPVLQLLLWKHSYCVVGINNTVRVTSELSEHELGRPVFQFTWKKTKRIGEVV